MTMRVNQMTRRNNVSNCRTEVVAPTAAAVIVIVVVVVVVVVVVIVAVAVVVNQNAI